MERQIPRSIQYSDLRPEVIENQVKLVRFTPQTNIQNQVPNDIVRFQLQGNGFYDPYSAYISMTVDFGEPETSFTIAGTAAPLNTGLYEMQMMWNNVRAMQSSFAVGDSFQAEPSNSMIDTAKIGCILSDLELDHQNMIVRRSRDGVFDTGLTIDPEIYSTRNSVTELNSMIQNTVANAAQVEALPVQYSTRILFPNILNDVGTSCLTTFVQPNYQAVVSAQAGQEALVNTTAYQLEQADVLYGRDITQKHIPIPGAEFKMLDRSAHSFINRLVIRSQGTEIERIEQYDVVAGMLNDMIYSNEQAQFHSFEGFGGTPLSQTTQVTGLIELQRSCVGNSVMGPRGRCGERIWGWAFVGVDEDNWFTQNKNCIDLTYDLDITSVQGSVSVGKLQLSGVSNGMITMYSNSYKKLMYPLQRARDGPPNQNLVLSNASLPVNTLTQTEASESAAFYGLQCDPQYANNGAAWANLIRSVHLQKTGGVSYYLFNGVLTARTTSFMTNSYQPSLYDKIFGGIKNHPVQWFLKSSRGISNQTTVKAVLSQSLSSDFVSYFRPGQYRMTVLGQQTYEFAIPIYSGLIGVLMPEKKLLPLSLMPLEVDFTLNPHALYTCYSQGYGTRLSRFYTMKRMEIYCHMVFFEQDVHRSMESIVAENGLFIHINTFYMAPVTIHPTQALTPTIPINLHFKNINSIHMVNLYSKYLTRQTARKLHFVSHNIQSIQIRNGTDLIPSEPLRSDNMFQLQTTDQNVGGGKSTRMFIELLKAYNKMHDPMCDVALDPGLVYLSDCYADTSSELATDFDVGGGSFSSAQELQNSVVADRVIKIANTFVLDQANAFSAFGQNSVYGAQILRVPAAAADIAGFQLADISGLCTASAARSIIRWIRLRGTVDGQVTSGIHKKGSWGDNPKHIGRRPTIFYAPVQGSITNAGVTEGDFWGISAGLLKDKIQRFTSMTGRCQIALSLEGINLGSDNSLLCGKRGMIPFDIMVTGGKNDRDQSLSLVFAKCDFIVYIRPDLVVTVLGK